MMQIAGYGDIVFDSDDDTSADDDDADYDTADDDDDDGDGDGDGDGDDEDIGYIFDKSWSSNSANTRVPTIN